LGDVTLEGHLAIPEEPGEIVIFAHGSGSSRHSPRNRLVAKRLNEARLATLLFDLLTKGEQLADQTTGEFRFDILLLARRLARHGGFRDPAMGNGGHKHLSVWSEHRRSRGINNRGRANQRSRCRGIVRRTSRSCMGIITASEFRIPWRHLIARRISGASFVPAMF
jgi:hypothetical protein